MTDSTLAFEIQLAAVALAASLAVGLPVRLAGWRASLAAAGLAWRFARARRWTLILIALAGAGTGLWSLESVRELASALLLR